MFRTFLMDQRTSNGEKSLIERPYLVESNKLTQLARTVIGSLPISRHLSSASATQGVMVYTQMKNLATLTTTKKSMWTSTKMTSIQIPSNTC